MIDFGQAFYLILRLLPNTVAFYDSDIDIAPEDNSSTVLESHSDAASTDEWVIAEVTRLGHCHVGHEESQIMVC